MTLQASGAISLNDIQTEFGGANPISLSEYYAGGSYVATGTAGIPSSSTISLNQFYGASSVIPAWILVIDSGTSTTAGALECLNAVKAYGGNLYATARLDPSVTYKGGIYTINPTTGSVISTLGVSTNSSSTGVVGIDIDSSGNKYISISSTGYVSGKEQALLLKLNSSNVVQWTQTINSPDYDAKARCVALTPNQSYVITQTSEVGSSVDTGFLGSAITHYSTGGTKSGSHRWFIMTTSTSSGTGIPLDNSVTTPIGANISFHSNGTNYAVTTTAKRTIYDTANYKYVYSSGGLTVKMQQDYTGTTNNGFRGTLSGSNNGQTGAGNVVIGDFVYALTTATPTADTNANTKYTTLTKMNFITPSFFSSTTTTWQRTLYSGSSAQEAVAVAKDSSDNIYLISNNDGVIHIAKYNTDGTIQWQRQLYRTNDNDGTTYKIYATSIIVDTTSTFVITGYRYSPSANFYSSLMIKLPVDGSKTGTYSASASFGGTWVYQAASWTESGTTTLTTFAWGNANYQTTSYSTRNPQYISATAPAISSSLGFDSNPVIKSFN